MIAQLPVPLDSCCQQFYFSIIAGKYDGASVKAEKKKKNSAVLENGKTVEKIN